MSFSKTTEDMSELMDSILKDIPKVYRGNKSAAQRVRTATIKLSKVSKEWRKMSLESEKQEK